MTDMSEEREAFLRRFAALVHDMRSPMASVTGAAELLESTRLDPVQRRYLQILQRGTAAVLENIDNLLDLQQAQRAGLELVERDFYLYDVLERAMDLISDDAGRKGLDVSYRLLDDVPTYLRGDVNRIHRMLGNLVANAAKYTEQGHVSIAAKAHPIVAETAEVPSGSPSQNVRLTFSVIDSGPGVPSSLEASLFEPFWRLPAHADIQGTGLGLSVARTMARAMGGDVSYRRVQGETVFEAHVECTVQEDPERQTVQLPFPRGDLVVDIIAPTQTSAFITDILSSWGAQVRPFWDRQELKGAEKVADPHRRVVLLSCPPAENDEELDVPIVYLAAPSDLEALSRESQAVLLPVQRAPLLAAITSATVPGIKIRRGRKGSELGIRRVLLVEDDLEVRTIVQALLDSQGFLVDAQSTLEGALAAYRDGAPHVVVTDLRLGSVDGTALLTRVRALERNAGREPRPIIALTAYADQRQIDRVMTAGFSDYLVKPIDGPSLGAVLRRHLGSRPSRPPRESSSHAPKREGPDDQPVVKPRGAVLPTSGEMKMALLQKDFRGVERLAEALFQKGESSEIRTLACEILGALSQKHEVQIKEQLRRLVELENAAAGARHQKAGAVGAPRGAGSAAGEAPVPATGERGENPAPREESDLVASLRPRFLERTKTSLAGLDEAIAKRSVDHVRRVAHQIAGASGTFGYPTLTDLGRLLESSALQEDFEAVAQHVGALRAKLSQILQAEAEKDEVSTKDGAAACAS